MRKLKHVKRFFEAVEDDFETMPQAQEEIEDFDEMQGEDDEVQGRESQGADDDKLEACIGQAQECIAKIEDCISQKEEEEAEEICCCEECKAVLEFFIAICDHREHTQFLDDAIALVQKAIPSCKEACGEMCDECLTGLEECLAEL